VSTGDPQRPPPPAPPLPSSDPVWDRNIKRARDVIGLVAGTGVLAYSAYTDRIWGLLVGAALLTGTFVLGALSRSLDRR